MEELLIVPREAWEGVTSALASERAATYRLRADSP